MVDRPDPLPLVAGRRAAVTIGRGGVGGFRSPGGGCLGLHGKSVVRKSQAVDDAVAVCYVLWFFPKRRPARH